MVATIPVMLRLRCWSGSPHRGQCCIASAAAGTGGCEFELLKFRSMVHNRRDPGPGLTPAGDSRVTPVGRMLAGGNWIELPQLFNVIRGDMSLVARGPTCPSTSLNCLHGSDRCSASVPELPVGQRCTPGGKKNCW